MSDWQTLQLRQVGAITTSNVDKKTIDGERPVRLCNYMDVYSNEYITAGLPFMEASATLAEIAKFKVENGDVMITKDSETPYDIGIPAVVVDDIPDLVCGYHLAHIKPQTDLVDPVYLAKQLASHEVASYFSRVASGSTRYGLSSGAIGDTPIPVAPLGIQKRIAEILRTVDEAIEHTEALIAKTQQIKAGLMHDLFTRGVTADGKLRPPREEAPELYRETPLGWLPSNWIPRPLGTITTYQHGRPFPSSEYGDEGVLLLRPGNLHQDGFVLFDDAHTTRLPEEWRRDAPSFLLGPGDIVMNLTAQSLEDGFLGRVCINEEAEPALLNQRIARFVPLGIGSSFLYWLLRSFQFRSQIERTAQGTKVQHLYNRDIDRVQFMIPAGSWEQEKIGEMLWAAASQVRIEQAGLSKLQSFRQGLMADLLSGRVEVSETGAAHE